jgi:2-dehydropantoate 2-reductase
LRHDVPQKKRKYFMGRGKEIFLVDQNIPEMRFLCFGVGAIGTYIGGSLALAGHKVVFIERPAVADEVRQRGISLQLSQETDDIRRVAEPDVADNLKDALALGPFDAAILAVKAFDTAGVIENMMPHLAALPPVISFQNGVENEPALAQVLGKDKVIAGTVTTAVGRKGTGEIVVERLRGIGLAVDHPLGESLVPVMNAAGLRARGYKNPAAMKWSKMLTNLLANATSAILDMTPAQIFADRKLYEIEARQLQEALSVMNVQNIPVVDLPSTPVRLLAWIVSALPCGISRPLLERSVGKGRGAKMPSFHIDLHSGRGKSEVEYLNGAVARYGKKYHVRTPVNAALTEILLGLTAGEMEKEVFAHQPERLLAKIPGE